MAHPRHAHYLAWGAHDDWQQRHRPYQQHWDQQYAWGPRYGNR